MKKLLSAFLIGTLIVGTLSGCGSDTAKTDNDISAEADSTDETGKEDTDAVESSDEGEAEASKFTGSGLNEATALRVGYMSSFGDPLVALEEENGYLADLLSAYGVSVEYYEFENGPSLLEALAAGGIDVGDPVGDVPLSTSAAAGYPVAGIAAGAVDDTQNAMAILADNGSEITTLEDLKGKRVAANIGTAGHLFLVQALASAGLTTDDIELVSLTEADYVSAFEGDSIDAAVTANAKAVAIEEENVAKRIDLDFIPIGKSVFVANTDYAAANPELVAIYLESVLHYYDYFADNRDEVQQLTADRFGLSTDSLASYQNYTFVTELDDDFFTRFQNTADFLYDQGLIESPLDTGSVTDGSYLEEANRLYAAQ